MNASWSNSPTENAPGRRLLLATGGHLSPSPRIHYVNHPFTMPPGMSRIEVLFVFYRQGQVALSISLHDPHAFRGARTRHYVKGRVEVDLWMTPTEASAGAIAGPLYPGTWRAQVDVERLAEETDYEVQVWAESGAAAVPVGAQLLEQPAVRPGPAWYRGELHAHSNESDGKYPVEVVVDAACRAGLDFLSLSEHITVSHWRKLAALFDRPIALLHSCEITSHQGHANLHGIHTWVDTYVDRPGWGMNDAADATHAQGGLFCINHPLSGDFGWRSHDFDWGRADLLEVYHSLEGPNNNLQPALWDHHLQLGRRIVGVAGTDSHDPFTGNHRLGTWVTWVKAPELSERGIIAGLREGQVYASRGPELRFTATTPAGQQAGMWGALPLGAGPVTFHAAILTQEDILVFVLKNGYPFACLPLQASGVWGSVTFSDEPDRPAYYRLELHHPFHSEIYPGIEWRDYTTVQALSNPIWVGQHSGQTL